MRYSCQFCHFYSDEAAKLWESSDCPFEQFSNRLIIDRFFSSYCEQAIGVIEYIFRKLFCSCSLLDELEAYRPTHKGYALDQDSSFDFVKTNDMI